MKILSLNIRSLDKHFNELSCLLSAIVNMDIVAISEIGRKNIESRSAFLKNMGFNLIYDEPKNLGEEWDCCSTTKLRSLKEMT